MFWEKGKFTLKVMHVAEDVLLNACPSLSRRTLLFVLTGPVLVSISSHCSCSSDQTSQVKTQPSLTLTDSLLPRILFSLALFSLRNYNWRAGPIVEDWRS